MNISTDQARQFLGGLGYIDPIDPYPTDAAGNALNIDALFLTAQQQACLQTGSCNSGQLQQTVPMVRDPITGQILNPATGMPYSGQGGVNLNTLLILAAAAVIIYLLVQKS